MTNYNKEIIKQVEDLTIENIKLKEENKSLRAENRALRQEIKTLENSIEEMVNRAIEKATASLKESIKHLEAENERKDKEIMRLKAIIDKDSSNSSKPPSCNGFKKIPNSREKSGKKVGGQKGHDGKTLKIPENLDELVRDGKAEKRIVDYSGGTKKYISQWTVDIAIKAVYTEKRYRIGTELKEFHTVKPIVSYRENIKAFSVLLSNEGLIAESRLSEICKEISGGLITISEATIEKINREVVQKINTDEIKENY
jgi:cell division protein FtsB